MRTDSQFIESYVAAVQDEPHAEVHDRWVQELMSRDLMRNARVSLLSSSAMVVLTAVLLFGHVNLAALSGWLLACAALMGFCWYQIKQFDQMMLAQDAGKRRADFGAFFDRHGWSWPVSAMTFALPIALYYEKVPATTQYLCLIIVVGMGAMGASLMSANLMCQSRFSHALAGTTATAVLAHWLLQWPQTPGREPIVFLLLVFLFWMLMIYLGKYLYQLQRSGYSAQFGNEQLIHSLRQQTHAAAEAVQMKNNLLASAAHDLRQPVHALAFYADWLRNEPQLASSVLPKILAATDSVNTLFNSLFDFARIESGAIQINLSPVDIQQLIDEMSVQFTPAANQKNLYLRAQVEPAMLMSDPVQLRRIASNLLANAIRYTDTGGVIMKAKVVGSQLWLEISDSGVGIAPEHLPYVFKEFYRAPSHEGTADSFGLGLAIVQRLCRALGHTVSIHSVPGEGTRVRVAMALASSSPDVVI